MPGLYIDDNKNKKSFDYQNSVTQYYKENIKDNCNSINKNSSKNCFIMKGKSIKDISVLKIKSIDKNQVLDNNSNNTIVSSEKSLNNNNNKTSISLSSKNNLDSLKTSSNSNSIIYNPSEMAKISNSLSSTAINLPDKNPTSKSKSKSKLKTKSKPTVKDQDFSLSKSPTINSSTSQSSSSIQSSTFNFKNNDLNQKLDDKKEDEKKINTSTTAALANQNLLLSVDLDLNSSSTSESKKAKSNFTAVPSLFNQKNEKFSTSKKNSKVNDQGLNDTKENKEENANILQKNDSSNKNEMDKIEDTTSTLNILSDSLAVPLFDSLITTNVDTNNLILSSFVNTNDLVMNEANHVISTNQEDNSILINPLENQNLNDFSGINGTVNDGASPIFKKEVGSDFTSTLSPYQQLLMVEDKTHLSTPDQSINSPLYDTSRNNESPLPLSSTAASSSVSVSKNRLLEHELVGFTGGVKGQNSEFIDFTNVNKEVKSELENPLEPLMTPIQTYYQEKKDGIMKAQTPYFEKAKISPTLLAQSNSSSLPTQSLLQSPMDVDSHLLNSKSASINYLSPNSLVDSSTSMENARINNATVKVEPLDSTVNPNELKNISSPAYFTVDSNTGQTLVSPFSKTTYINNMNTSLDSNPSLLLVPESTGNGNRIATDPLLYQNVSSTDLLRKKLMVEQANKVSPSSPQMLPFLYQNQGVGNYLVRNKNVAPSSLINVNSVQTTTNQLLVNQGLRKNLNRKMNYYHPYASLQRFNNLNSLNRKALLRKSVLYNNSNLLNKNLYPYSVIPSNNVTMLYQNKLNDINSQATLQQQNLASVNTLKRNYDLNTINNNSSLPLWNQPIIDIPNQDGTVLQDGLDLSHGVGYISSVPASSTTSLNPLMESGNFKTLSGIEKTPQGLSVKNPMNLSLDSTEMNSFVDINSYYMATTGEETKGKYNNSNKR
ncbi:hypothetical protein PIROE2DRAFT_2483 [Piromyces sp. E2]|nr:hypothetical protein PIROE2DRAFT_2483 [Piromyces sp. E2]|eukprot:OUM69614.1 hypothetical protein PIROE2DRAFT_2483 [Piromyces sp. E2]